jgi:hypothetical protein
MATLYELRDEYLELLSMMEDPDVDPQTLADTMEGIEGELEDKAESYCVVMKELEAEKAKWDTEEARAARFSNTIGNNIARMKQALMASMQAIGKTKIQTEHFKLGVQKNGGIQPLKITGDVPDAFMVMEPKPDTKRIREALEEGFELDWAHLEERGVHLSVR